MTQAAGGTVENKFIGGLNTDATGISYPDNSFIEGENCRLEANGEINRRLGIDFEEGYTLRSLSGSEISPSNNVASVVYRWKNADGAGTIDIAVVQIGYFVYFYNLSNGTAVSDNFMTYIDISTYAVSGITTDQLKVRECEFTSGFGRLFMAHPWCDPVAFSYDADTDTFSAETITIIVRDTVGIEDGTVDHIRESTIDDLHRWNLHNQGWTNDFITIFQSATVPSGGSASDGQYYPSNTDVWWLYRNADDVFNQASVEAKLRSPRGDTPAPKGAIKSNAFYFDRNSTAIRDSFNAGTSYTLGADQILMSDGARPTAVAFFAGRVFYAGVLHKDFMSNIYVTKVLESDADFGKCYQTNSPTSEDKFDLLPSDGLVLKQPDMGRVYKLFPTGNSLLVFADNGIWAISGSQGIGFTATDYSFQKISSVSSFSAGSFVDAEGMPFFWNEDGIHTVQTQQGAPQVVSLTFNRIQNFYEEIPADNRPYARGVYNPITKTIQWVFRQQLSYSLNDYYFFDSILNYNTRLNAFYVDRIADSDNIYIGGIIMTDTTATEYADLEVSQDFRYFCKVYGSPFKITWGIARDTDYVDWASLSEADYDSFIITGNRIYGEAMKSTQIPYLFIHSRSNGDTQLDFQSRWEYTTTGNLGKWSGTQRVTFDTSSGRSVQTKRLRVRGMGKAVQLRFGSVSGQPMSLIGWSIFAGVNQNV